MTKKKKGSKMVKTNHNGISQEYKNLLAQYKNHLALMEDARMKFENLGSIEGTMSHKKFESAQERVKEYAMRLLTFGKQHTILAITYLFTFEDGRPPETYVDEFIDTTDYEAQSIIEFAAAINTATLTILDQKRTQPQRHSVKL